MTRLTRTSLGFATLAVAIASVYPTWAGTATAEVLASDRRCFAVTGRPGDAAIVNLTPVQANARGNGQLTSSDVTNPPTNSNVNFAPGTIDPNIAVAQIGTDGRVCFHNSHHADVHLIADHLGTIADTAYTPARTDGTHQRTVDTREYDIAYVQLLLNVAGFGTLVRDGIYGTATRQAVVRLQVSAGLPATSQLDDATYDALLRAAARFTYVEVCDTSQANRPNSFEIGCNQLSSFEDVVWSQWLPHRAIGKGTWRYPCPGWSCEDGSSYIYESINIRLRDAKRLRCGDFDPILVFVTWELQSPGEAWRSFTVEGPYC